ncbi:MAG: phenylacetate--CoA ligase family protein [Tissierellia bacterium]|nr:phenylacetate--CoA ligase family protein [Tissierellia bacterium]
MNKFKPSILFAYPTVMQLLLPHIKSGNLKIDPDIIVLGGETCFPELKEELEENFTARILNAYACTEANMITTQCSEGRLHINIDWVIIEAVDVNNNPVAKGVLSDKVLLTNLSNFLQPIIRYELTDRIAIYDEPCKCGSVMPYLYVEGRSNDMLEFEGVEGLVEISPMALGILGKVTGLIQYQIIQKSHNLMELRLKCQNGYDKAELFSQANEYFLEIFKNLGVENVEFLLSEDEPKTDPISGKLKFVIKEMDLN